MSCPNDKNQTSNHSYHQPHKKLPSTQHVRWVLVILKRRKILSKKFLNFLKKFKFKIYFFRSPWFRVILLKTSSSQKSLIVLIFLKFFQILSPLVVLIQVVIFAELVYWILAGSFYQFCALWKTVNRGKNT
jgi:hypothetical protein